jgi:hypothetical protein
VLAFAGTAHATTTTVTETVTSFSTTVTTVTGSLPAPTLGETKPRTSQASATQLLLAYPKVADWLKRYPKDIGTSATFADGAWTVHVTYGKAGEIATGKVDDVTGAVTEAWTGPQVAWKMARAYPGAFGGRKINSYSVWLGFCAAFLIGLIDWRRPFSIRNLDLLALVSLSVSLWFFNHGNVFAAMPAAYPPLFWILARCLWVGRRDQAPRGAPIWPAWLLIAATVFIAGFRVGLNIRSSDVIDVGYSGVIGADRIWHGQSPYGHFPVEDNRPACGPADSDGEIRDHIQTNGRCETANPLGDTYGPVSYIAYLPGYWIFGWSGKWDSLHSVHFTSIVFDILALLGLGLVGRRLGGPRVGAALAFAWVTWPFTQYASMSNTNDAIAPALLTWGFLALTSPALRGVTVALSGWTKFASLLVVPLWSGYPEARRGRDMLRFALWFCLTTIAVFFVLFLEPSPIHAARVFWDRTVSFQIGRHSPFSLWDWGQYHARGLPDLSIVQHVLQVALVLGSLALGWWPRHRSPLRMAAFTAALLIGFEVVLTHWSYLYLPWFFPFVALALVAPVPGAPPEPENATLLEPEAPPTGDDGVAAPAPA